MYSALNLSTYIISKCIKDHKPISNLQLQKILYCIQKDYISRDTLAFPDSFEYRQSGPIVPSVYFYHCGSGAMTIVFEPESFEIEEHDKQYIDPIVEHLRDLTPWELDRHMQSLDKEYEKTL